jgi:hypothetical protein
MLLRDALALAVERYGTELGKKMLLRLGRYRALDGDGAPVEGDTCDLADMMIDWKESSARPAFQFFVPPGDKIEPGRRLHRIELLRADVPGAPTVPAPKEQRVRGISLERPRDRAKRGLLTAYPPDGKPPLRARPRDIKHAVGKVLGEDTPDIRTILRAAGRGAD